MMLQWALYYASIGWPVFRLSGGKTPLRGSHGHLDATTDEAVIRSWWVESGPNIGLACGVIVVFDADGPGGLAAMGPSIDAQGVVTWNGWPPTWVARTRRGYHFFYKTPPGVELRTHNAPRAAKGADGLDLKGARGYVVLAPSVNAEGVRYVWLIGPHQMPGGPAELHPEGQALWEARRPNRERAPVSDSFVQPALVDLGLGEPPAWATSERDTLTEQMFASELVEVIEWLKLIPAALGYEEWRRMGAAIHHFDPGPRGLALFKAWSCTSSNPKHQDADGACEEKWVGYINTSPDKALATKASIRYEAEKRVMERLAAKPEEVQVVAPTVETPESPTPDTHAAGINGTPVIPQEITVSQITAWRNKDPRRAFPDLKNVGSVSNPIWIAKPTTANTVAAIEKLGIACAHDVFHERMTVGSQEIAQWSGELSDYATVMLRAFIKEKFQFDPGKQHTEDAAMQLCLENQFNPITDYLRLLQWDRRERLNAWAVRYLGAPDTVLSREIGRLMLIAAVRRARQPGTKFDQIVVLEGREGTGKSSAIRILAGEDNFSDQTILGKSDREQQEAFRGVWLHEIADLAGMRRADVEHVKAFASRQEDRARPAYARHQMIMKRRGIFVATTNDYAYLKSDTGNRRFWPLATRRIDMEGIARDRDQLWAEAAWHEAQGASLVLGEQYRRDATQEQADRVEADAWHETIKGWTEGREDVSSLEVLTGCLHLQVREIGQIEQNRVARVLKTLGFERYQKRVEDEREWRYRRFTSKKTSDNPISGVKIA